MVIISATCRVYTLHLDGDYKRYGPRVHAAPSFFLANGGNFLANGDNFLANGDRFLANGDHFFSEVRTTTNNFSGQICDMFQCNSWFFVTKLIFHTKVDFSYQRWIFVTKLHLRDEVDFSWRSWFFREKWFFPPNQVQNLWEIVWRISFVQLLNCSIVGLRACPLHVGNCARLPSAPQAKSPRLACTSPRRFKGEVKDTNSAFFHKRKVKEWSIFQRGKWRNGRFSEEELREKKKVVIPSRPRADPEPTHLKICKYFFFTERKYFPHFGNHFHCEKR